MPSPSLCCLAVALALGPAPATQDATPLIQVADLSMHAHDAAETFTVGDLVIENAWARESVTPTGAAYLTVRNQGEEDDRLVGIAADVAERAEIHSTAMQDGVMRMRPVDAVEVPAHGEAVLAPGGLHVMLIGLKGPLEEGKSFALTLAFENAGEIQVMTTIEDIAHGGPGHAPDEHGHGH